MKNSQGLGAKAQKPNSYISAFCEIATLYSILHSDWGAKQKLLT